MFLVRFIGKRLFGWLRGRNPSVARLFLVGSVLGWLWRRFGGRRTVVLDSRTAYRIDVGPAVATEGTEATFDDVPGTRAHRRQK